MAILLRVSLPLGKIWCESLDQNHYWCIRNTKLHASIVIPKSRGVGGASFGSHGWISPIEAPVNSAIWATWRHTGKKYFFPWLFLGLVQIGSGERLKLYFITFSLEVFFFQFIFSLNLKRIMRSSKHYSSPFGHPIVLNISVSTIYIPTSPGVQRGLCVWWRGWRTYALYWFELEKSIANESYFWIVCQNFSFI